MGEIELGYSFDDVLLVPQRSGITPADADLRTRLTARIPLNIPIVSSAMDTVSEDVLAIALAREGGIGVIHRNCSIEKQAEMVARVKRSENMIIPDPFTVSAEMTIRDLQSVMDLRGVNGFPVVDSDNRLKGMVTTRDIWYIEAPDETKVGDVMTPREKLVTGEPETAMQAARALLFQKRIEKLPLVDADDHLVGLITAQDIEKRQQFTDAAKDEQGRLRVGAAVGSGPQALDRARALIQAGANALFIDAATGHTGRVLELIGQLRELSDDVDVVAGNVVTREGARDLIDAGAAAVKVGVGPGSICTTRVIAGVGVPQFSAIRDVAAEARDRGVPRHRRWWNSLLRRHRQGDGRGSR